MEPPTEAPTPRQEGKVEPERASEPAAAQGPTPCATPPAGVGAPRTSPEGAREGRIAAKAAGDTAANFEQVTSELINVARDIHISYFEGSTGAPGFRAFSLRDTWEVPGGEADLDELFVAPRDRLADGLARLEQGRLLLLSGPKGIGKATMAKYLSHRLAKRRGFSETARFVPALDRNVRIDLRQLADDEAGYGRRTTIFGDVLSRGNHDLRALLGNEDGHAWRDLRTRLGRIDAFLIFTAASPDVAGFHHPLSEAGVHLELTYMPQELLADWCALKLASLRREPRVSASRLEAVAARREAVCAELKSIPAMTRFLHFYMAGEESDLERSLRRFRDAKSWLDAGEAGTFGAWSFGLSLALTQCVRGADGIPWITFDRFRTEVVRHLEEAGEAERFRRQPEASEGEPPPRRLADPSDDELLESCRAEVVKEPTRLDDVIRFRDESYATDAWSALLLRHRRVLTRLLEPLRRIAEEHAEPEQRMLAAQVLGRIGEIDPGRITFAILGAWIAGSKKRRPMVGRLLQGALSSSNQGYRDLCLRYLESLAEPRGSDADAAGDAPSGADDGDRLLTAIAAWSQVGVFEPALALRQLGAISRAHLAAAVADVHHIARYMERIEGQLRDARSSDRSVELLVSHTLLELLANRIYSQRWGAFIAVRYALLRIATVTDPVQVLRGLRDWISIGGHPMGMLVTFLFLQERGLAAGLEETEPASGPEYVLSPLVSALAADPGGPSQLAAFLADVWESMHSPFSLPASALRYFRASFLEHLAVWARQAVGTSSCRAAVIDLLATLAQVRAGALLEPLLGLLHDRRFTATREMALLAEDVRRRIDAAARGQTRRSPPLGLPGQTR